MHTVCVARLQRPPGTTSIQTYCRYVQVFSSDLLGPKDLAEISQARLGQARENELTFAILGRKSWGEGGRKQRVGQVSLCLKNVGIDA